MKAALVFGLLGALVGYSAAFNVCKPCLGVVSFIESELTRDEGKEDAELDRLCTDEVPAPFNKVCSAIVNQALKLVINDIDTKQPPNVVCHECHLCSSEEIAAVQTEGALQGGINIGQVCQLLDQAEAALKSGQLDAVCQKLQSAIKFPAAVCKQISSQEALLENVIQKAESLAQCSSSEAFQTEKVIQDGIGLGQICQLLDQAEAALKSGQLDAVCQKLQSAIKFPPAFCKKISSQEALLENVIQEAESLAQCSSSDSESQALILAAGEKSSCEVAQEMLGKIQNFVSHYLPLPLEVVANSALMPYLRDEVAKICAAPSAQSLASVSLKPFCNAVAEAESLLNDGFFDKACAIVAQYAPQVNCQEIKADVEPKIKEALTIAEDFCKRV